MKRILLTVFFAALVAANLFGDSLVPTFALFPNSGTVSGIQGSVVGWGYDITNNDPADWLVLNDSFVTGDLSTGTFGTYVDYIASNFIVIGPSSSTGDVAFNQGAAGTGEFDINAFVPPTTITGAVNIDYSLFSQDPNNPNFDPGSFITSGTVSAAAAVQVVGVSTVPEPASVLFTGLALLPVALTGWRRRKFRRF